MKEDHQSFQSLKQFVTQLSLDEQKMLKDILSSNRRISEAPRISVEESPLLTTDEMDAIMQLFKSGAT
ncbi:hypothetical protein [Enterovibrio baiacu]|uniref:hypothetical protein n=1 Tax=Enterovibrio baiacu TaxID=2491023 RepID=UPI001012908D|nr:hypothetical protein [Enterovibrio baiacu]MBE1274810.1 hypothetical protein [Enterovibrio baiacu]